MFVRNTLHDHLACREAAQGLSGELFEANRLDQRRLLNATTSHLSLPVAFVALILTGAISIPLLWHPCMSQASSGTSGPFKNERNGKGMVHGPLDSAPFLPDPSPYSSNAAMTYEPATLVNVLAVTCGNETTAPLMGICNVIVCVYCSCV